MVKYLGIYTNFYFASYLSGSVTQEIVSNSVTSSIINEGSFVQQASRPAADEARTKVAVYAIAKIEKRPFPRAPFVFHAREPVHNLRKFVISTVS